MTELVELTANNDLEALRGRLAELDVLDIAEELARLPAEQMAVPFRLLDKDRALAVFEALDPVHQQQLLEGLREERVNELVAAMDTDDRARLLDEMPAKVAKRMQAGLPPDQRAATATLLGYEAESAGRIMSPHYVSLPAAMTAAEAIEKVRRVGGDVETIYTLPVTDDRRRLVGVTSLRELVTAPADTQVEELMISPVLHVSVATDQEEAARLIQEADLLALPVVDNEARLVGGVAPLEQPYLSAGVLTLARKRAGWLLLLGIAAVLTVNVLGAFEETLEAVVTLSLFIPLLIDTGGNSGAQASTVVIRALSVGEVRFRDLPWVVGREVIFGVLLGLMLGAIAFPLVSLVFGVEFGIIIGLTLVLIVIWATVAGAALPLLAQRLGLDPAVLSAPIITTLVDATGLLIYLGIAVAVLSEQLEAAVGAVWAGLAIAGM